MEYCEKCAREPRDSDLCAYCVEILSPTLQISNRVNSLLMVVMGSSRSLRLKMLGFTVTIGWEL